MSQPITPVPEPLIRGLAELGGYRNSERFQRYIDSLYFDPDAQDVLEQNELLSHLQLRIRQKGVMEHPFAPAPPKEILDAGTLLFASIFGYDEPVTASLDHHIYITGPTGRGKTWLAKILAYAAYLKGIQTIVFDPVGTLTRDLLGIVPPSDLYFVEPDSFAISPFQHPPNVTMRQWIWAQADVDREVWSYRRGSENFSNSVKFGMLQVGSQIHLRSFLAAVKAAEPHRSDFRLRQYFDTVLNTVQGLVDTLPSLTVHESAGLLEIYRRPMVIFDWESIGSTQFKTFLTLHALNWLRRWKGSDSEKPTLVIVDEVNELASKDARGMNDITQGFFVDCLRRSRNQGVCMVMLDQTPSKTHDVIRANSDTKIIFAPDSGGDKRIISDDLSLTPDQRDFLGALPPRHVLVKLPFVPEPFLAVLPEVKHVRKVVDSDSRVRPGQAA